MKVLQIINSLATGGAEKLIIDTLPLYVKQGLKVDLLLLNGDNHPFLDALVLKNCCQIFSLGNSSVYNPLSIFKIIPYLKKYDLVHVHLFPAQYCVVLAKVFSFSKTKLVFTEHNTSNKRMASTFFSIIDRLFYKSYTVVIAISDGVASAIKKHLRSKDKIRIIHNGINLKDSISAQPNNELISFLKKTNEVFLVQVGGFRIQKDQDTTIRALSLLPSNYHLLLVGDGERRDELENLVHKLALEKRVHFTGIRTDVHSILQSVDIIIVSSHWEGFGLAAAEGMAVSKPVIASDVPGLSEVVKGAGILFPQGDAEQLAKEIIHLCTDPDYYRTVAEACQQRAADYDISKMVDKHIALYRSLIN